MNMLPSPLVVRCISGAVGYRLDFAGLSFAFSGHTRPCWPLVRACEEVTSNEFVEWKQTS